MLEQAASNKTGWTIVAFGDVVRLSKARSKDPESEGYRRVVGLEHIDPGDPCVRRWADISEGTTFTSVFQPGQVLFGKRRAYLRKVAVANFSGVCSGDIFVFEPSTDALMSELLPFICQSDAFFEHAVGTSAGSLSPRTNWKSLASFEFLLPPGEEQRELVKALKASQRVVEGLYQLVFATKQLRQSAIDHFARVGADRQDTLGALCEMQNGRAFPGDAYTTEGIRLLRPGNLGIGGYLSWNDTATTHLPSSFETEAQAFIVDEGDVVINLTAQSLEDGFMGRVCRTREGEPGGRGWLPTHGSHRSGHAPLGHPAPRTMASLLNGTHCARLALRGGDRCCIGAQSAPMSRVPASFAGRAICATAVPFHIGIGSAPGSCR